MWECAAFVTRWTVRDTPFSAPNSARGATLDVPPQRAELPRLEQGSFALGTQSRATAFCGSRLELQFKSSHQREFVGTGGNVRTRVNGRLAAWAPDVSVRVGNSTDARAQQLKRRPSCQYGVLWGQIANWLRIERARRARAAGGGRRPAPAGPRKRFERPQLRADARVMVSEYQLRPWLARAATASCARTGLALQRSCGLGCSARASAGSSAGSRHRWNCAYVMWLLEAQYVLLPHAHCRLFAARGAARLAVRHGRSELICDATTHARGCLVLLRRHAPG